MLEPPVDLPDETLHASLRAAYGLAGAELTFLPLGHDANAWVYRVRAPNDRVFFLKARRGAVNEAGLLAPHHLHAQGITHVVAPLPTGSGALWAVAGGYALILYPFIAGTTGRERRLTDQQWRDYGALLRQVHAAPIAPVLARLLPRETFRPVGADMIRQLNAHLGAGAVANPDAQALTTFWQAHQAQIGAVLARATALGQQLARSALPSVLCHADIHVANVLLDDEGRVWFVDWDEVVLAPRERDLMFLAGGFSRAWVGPREEALAFQGYGVTTVDPLALAYYRCAWAVNDIGAYGEQICFRPDLGAVSRRDAVARFMSLFAPGEIVALAAEPLPAGRSVDGVDPVDSVDGGSDRDG